ncbi:MAG TPA: LutB/LldF family L-lactate oxidation iron-sulfur protein [Ktedonobacteraceae bacterium]|jgi:L-lactate dehydrogenase complex protein LldF|nr:LutB/LldF family L-lactate oxidation iron-sulfur protein [Ktedonobacteraceae bacterium]
MSDTPALSQKGRPLPTFQSTARQALGNAQLRRNMYKATHTIRDKRERVVAEMPDWEDLREAGRALKERVLRHLDSYLLELEASVQRAGGHVHWARDAQEASALVAQIVEVHGAREVIKIKSLTTDEIGLNNELASRGIEAIETDLAELIIQLAGEPSSHILVPAIHKNRAEIRELFRRKLGVKQLSDEPRDLANAARAYLRRKFLSAQVAISGANFAVAETGSIAVVESEGNGRMCLTLPRVLISVMGLEKVIPTWQDLEVFLQLLPRSSTAERMNPYTSLWTGVREGDGPQEFHLVLLDNGRTQVLADTVGRQTLNCIRCSACLNICPVYERTGGHAYSSVYPGPIGAILTPQLIGLDKAGTLPYASSLCGACYDVCPVKINIPQVLIYLRGQIVRKKQLSKQLRDRVNLEGIAMRLMARTFANRSRYEQAQRLALLGQLPLKHGDVIEWLPGELGQWTIMRDLPAVPEQSFREWWRSRPKPEGQA